MMMMKKQTNAQGFGDEDPLLSLSIFSLLIFWYLWILARNYGWFVSWFHFYVVWLASLNVGEFVSPLISLSCGMRSGLFLF
jgi:hypothetical protein